MFFDFLQLFVGMSTVMCVDGTIITGGKGEVRIYVKKKYWDRLKPYIGKGARILLVIENEDS